MTQHEPVKQKQIEVSASKLYVSRESRDSYLARMSQTNKRNRRLKTAFAVTIAANMTLTNILLAVHFLF